MKVTYAIDWTLSNEEVEVYLDVARFATPAPLTARVIKFDKDKREVTFSGLREVFIRDFLGVFAFIASGDKCWVEDGQWPEKHWEKMSVDLATPERYTPDEGDEDLMPWEDRRSFVLYRTKDLTEVLRWVKDGQEEIPSWTWDLLLKMKGDEPVLKELDEALSALYFERAPTSSALENIRTGWWPARWIHLLDPQFVVDNLKSPPQNSVAAEGEDAFVEVDDLPNER